MNRPLICGVVGCSRRADTVIDGANIQTGEPLPVAYACDDPEHQYVVALAILPSGARLPDEPEAILARQALAAWNESQR
jgi:hypothetical protein